MSNAVRPLPRNQNHSHAQTQPPILPHYEAYHYSSCPTVFQIPTPAHDEEHFAYHTLAATLSSGTKPSYLTAHSAPYALAPAMDVQFGRGRTGTQHFQDTPTPDEEDTETPEVTGGSASSLFSDVLRSQNVKYGLDDVEPPKDFDTLRSLLNEDRRSPSPDERHFRNYRTALKTLQSVEDMQDRAWDFLAIRRPVEDEYRREDNILWEDVEAPITTVSKHPQGRISESYPAYSYPPLALQSLGSALRPHFAVACSTPRCDFVSTITESAYNGAVMAEAARSVHRFMKQPDEQFDRATMALTVAFNGLCLDIFANHAVLGDNLAYHQVPLTTDRPWFSLEEFKLAYKHVRNAQDWAQAYEQHKRSELMAHEKRTYIAIAQAAVDTERATRVACACQNRGIVDLSYREPPPYIDVRRALMAWLPP